MKGLIPLALLLVSFNTAADKPAWAGKGKPSAADLPDNPGLMTGLECEPGDQTCQQQLKARQEWQREQRKQQKAVEKEQRRLDKDKRAAGREARKQARKADIERRRQQIKLERERLKALKKREETKQHELDIITNERKKLEQGLQLEQEALARDERQLASDSDD